MSDVYYFYYYYYTRHRVCVIAEYLPTTVNRYCVRKNSIRTSSGAPFNSPVAWCTYGFTGRRWKYYIVYLLYLHIIILLYRALFVEKASLQTHYHVSGRGPDALDRRSRAHAPRGTRFLKTDGEEEKEEDKERETAPLGLSRSL